MRLRLKKFFVMIQREKKLLMIKNVIYNCMNNNKFNHKIIKKTKFL